jgi:hypothetical protein
MEMLDDEALERTDHGIGATTGDFGLHTGGVHVGHVLGERGDVRPRSFR